MVHTKDGLLLILRLYVNIVKFLVYIQFYEISGTLKLRHKFRD